MNPCRDLLANLKNGGSDQRSITFTWSEIIEEWSLIWYFSHKPEPHLRKKRLNLLSNNFKEYHNMTPSKNQQLR